MGLNSECEEAFEGEINEKLDGKEPADRDKYCDQR